MRRPKSATELVIAGVLIFAAATGCQNNTQKGALVGGAGGAAVGAIVGKQMGNTGEGALVGALAGGALGGLVGNSEDEAQKRHEVQARQQAYAQAAYRQQRS